MINRTTQQDMQSEGVITFEALQSAADALRRRGDLRHGGIKSWIDAVIVHWDESLSTRGEEFRTDESVLEQHFLASLPKDDWRFPYGVDGSEGYQLMREIKRRREHGLSLAGLAWPPSDDPYAPANDPHHPYFLG
jgi:hypothetical protein